MTVRARLDLAFANLGHAIGRRPKLAIVIMLLLIAAPASQLPNATFDTSTEAFLHPDDPTLSTYNEFRDQFGRDEIIIVSLRPKAIFDFEFLEMLREIHDRIEEEVPYLDEVTSLVNARATRGSEGELIVEDLMEEWPETPEQLRAIEAYARNNESYRNLLLSQDLSLTTIAIKTNHYSELDAEVDFETAFGDHTNGSADSEDDGPRYLTVEENAEVALRVQELLDEYRDRGVEIHVAGSPIVMEAVKSSMQRDMFLFIRLTLISIGVLLLVLFRRASAVGFPLIVVIGSLLSTVGIMVAAGTSIKLPTVILPSFLMAVGIGYTVHILTLFYRAFDSGLSAEDAVSSSLEHSGLPVLLTSLTTAGGLMSFLPSELAPIADLGLFAPIGVMISWMLSVVLLPALLCALPLRRRQSDETSVPMGIQFEPQDRLDRFLRWAADFSADRPWTVVGISAVIGSVALASALQVKISHDPTYWLPEGSPSLVATKLIDEKLRGSITLEVLLTREGENAWYEPAQLQKLDQFSTNAMKYESESVYIGNAFSALNVLKEINRALNENRDAYYSIPESRELIAQEFLLFENSGSDDLEDLVDSQFSQLRLTLKGPFTDSVHYADAIPEIESMAKATLGPDTEVVLSGVIPMLFRTMTAVNISMTRSYAIAFAVIAILMVLLIGKAGLGLIAMIPNLFPIVLAMGLMGVFTMPLDTFTLMIASISLGLAVDDTIHFMHNYLRYLREEGDSRIAIRYTLATTGRAMLFTTLVLASSFTIFTLSEMNNIFNFGALTSFAITMAFVADILLAPSLMHLIHRNRESSVEA